MNRVDINMVTTANDLAGYRIVRSLGMVRGIVVRSRSVIGTIGAGLQTLIGGNITIFTELCEKTREEAFELMLQHAAERGANAVVAMRYDANDSDAGCYRSAGVRDGGRSAEAELNHKGTKNTKACFLCALCAFVVKELLTSSLTFRRNFRTYSKRHYAS